MATTTKLVELFNADATVAAAATTTAFVELAYENLLGLSGDFSNKDERVGYWVGKINSGVVSKADFAATFLAAAAVQGDLLTNAEFAANTETLKAIAELDEATLTTLADVQAALETAGVVTPDTTGQTFTLTTSVDTLTGTANDDTFNATETATSSVLGGLDSIDGGAGTDTLNIADTATAAATQFTLVTGLSVSNVENVNVTTNGGVSLDLSSNAGVTAIKTVAAGTANTAVTASGTADVTTTVAGTATTTVTGGKTVSVTGVTGATNVAGKALDNVTVVKGGAVTINNQANTVAATANTGTTLTSVTLDQVNAASGIGGQGLESVTVKGATAGSNTVTITNALADHALTVNVDGTGYDTTGAAQTTTVVDAVAKTITVNATGAKSNVALTGSTTATTVNITGDAALTLAALASATKIDGSAATGNLTLGDLSAATVTASTGAGDDSFAVQATAKTTVDSGAGNDSVTLKSALAAGSTINLGAGDDKLLVIAGNSVTPSTTAATTTIDGGEGTDTVSAELINAANAQQFVNFEAIDASLATTTPLDTELMTASTITGLTLSGGVGGATVNNVAAGVGLSVSGSNTGVTTIGVKGATTATTDTFTVTFDGAAVTTTPTVANVAAGTVVLAGVEAVTLASDGAANTWNSITLTDDKLKTVAITGSQNLDLAFTGTNGTNVAAGGGAISLIDGSAATGKLSINTTNVTADNSSTGLTVKGGAAVDTITLAQTATVDAGAGNDTITTAATFGGNLTGGAGNDKFDVSASVATGTTEAAAVLTTIADFTAGDSIKLLAGNTAGTLGTAVTLATTVTNIDQAIAQAAMTDTANEVSWFQYGNNTYIVANDATAGFAAGDLVVKLTGLIDLSNATLDGTTDYLTL